MKELSLVDSDRYRGRLYDVYHVCSLNSSLYTLYLFRFHPRLSISFSILPNNNDCKSYWTSPTVGIKYQEKNPYS